MKKLVLVALMATSAFAFNGKGMVELNDCFDGNRCSNLDFNMSTDDADDNELDEMNFAFNYNYLFTNNFGAGLKYVSQSETRDGDISDSIQDENFNTIGLNFFWNFDGGWESMYAAVRYDMTSFEESDDDDTTGSENVTVTTLEFGKRMEMGKVFGMPVLYSPSATYSMANSEFYADGSDDLKSTELRLNVANFAVTF